jgi:hypothetical protein
MKKIVLFLAVCLSVIMPAKAQWDRIHTSIALSSVIGLARESIESAERKKAMEIHAQQKVQFEQDFKDSMTEAKDYELAEDWEEALNKYEEAAKLNCQYGYSDQRQITKKINELYIKAGQEEDGPSILNNAKTILPDYSQYRYVRENPVYVNKKQTKTKIVRVACSDKETRLELEYEASAMDDGISVRGTAYIRGNKGGKLGLVGIENITMAPSATGIPWPYQKLRFVLIFPPLPDDAKEFDFIVPSSVWQFKDIKCM